MWSTSWKGFGAIAVLFGAVLIMLGTDEPQAALAIQLLGLMLISLNNKTGD
jgi:hypothetical protein